MQQKNKALTTPASLYHEGILNTNRWGSDILPDEHIILNFILFNESLTPLILKDISF